MAISAASTLFGLLVTLALAVGNVLFVAAATACPSTPLAEVCLSRLACRNATLTQCTLGCYAQSLQCYVGVDCRSAAEDCTSTLSDERTACATSALACFADGSCTAQHAFRCGQALLLVTPAGNAPANTPQSDWAIGLAVSTVLLALVVVVCFAVIARMKKQLDHFRSAGARYIGIEVKPLRHVSNGTPSSLSSSIPTAGRSPSVHLSGNSVGDEKRLSGVSLELSTSTRERHTSESLSQAHVQICPESADDDSV